MTFLTEILFITAALLQAIVIAGFWGAATVLLLLAIVIAGFWGAATVLLLLAIVVMAKHLAPLLAWLL